MIRLSLENKSQNKSQSKNEIGQELLAKLSKETQEEPFLRLRMNAVTKEGAEAAAFQFSSTAKTKHVFSNEIEAGEITNQKSSGRCWLFAAMNTMRVPVMKKCNLETFELSESYMMFWDKLEKCNFFLESIIKTANEPLEGRLVNWLLDSPYGDGGQWDMVVSLVEKYGVVPKEEMPESFSSSASKSMNNLLTLKARENAKILRHASHEGKSQEIIHEIKEQMVAETYKMLCIFLGTPPATFDFEYKNKDGNYFRDNGLTGKSFYDKYVGQNLSDYVSLIHAPTRDKPYHNMFTVNFLGNVVGGREIRYLNLPVENLKRAASAQILDGEVVWFGCDVKQSLDAENGIMALDTFDYGLLLGTKFSMNKGERLDYRESCMSHAMVFTGVNIENGKSNRWKVENSWGDAKGKKGWYVMSDDWFSEFTYQIVVNKKYLTKEEQADLLKAPLELEPWDPMGSLA